MSSGLRRFVWQGEGVASVSLQLAAFHEHPLPMRERSPGRFEVEAALPDDASVGYGFLVDPLGAEPATGWSLHRVVPGADAEALIPRPWGAAGTLAVSTGATARVHPAWRTDAAPGSAVRTRSLRTASDRPVLLLGDGPVRTLAVVFDGDLWSDPATGFLDAVARWGRADLHLALVSTRDRAVLDRRAEMLAILREVLAAVEATGARVIAAGQSYGGLAAAGLLADAPDLVDAAVLQSGSFWFEEGLDRADQRLEATGTLVRRLRSGEVAGDGRRVVVQVGRAEGPMVDRSRDFAAAAEAAGFDVVSEVWAGGHDHAWYRHGLLTGLDALLDGRAAAQQER